MADRTSHVGLSPVINPLLSAAETSFPFENFTSTAQLVPITQRGSSIQLSEDAGEVDSFLGQDALPSLPLPGVLPPVLKTPSAEQLQPITFFNALGQPTGGGGLDFLAPAGANSKSSDLSFQPRHKSHINKRRAPIPSSCLSTVPSYSQTTASLLTPALPPSHAQVLTESNSSEVRSSSSRLPHLPPPSAPKSNLFQEPPLISQVSLLPPKSQSTPASPKVQLQSQTLSNQPDPPSSQSQPPTVQPSPVHLFSSSGPSQVNQSDEHLSCDKVNDTLLTSKQQYLISSDKNQIIKSLVSELAGSTSNISNTNTKSQDNLTQLSSDTSTSILGTSVENTDSQTVRKFSSPELDDLLTPKIQNFSLNKSTQDLGSDSQVDLSKSNENLNKSTETVPVSTETQISNQSTESSYTTHDTLLNPRSDSPDVADHNICAPSESEASSQLHRTTDISCNKNQFSEEPNSLAPSSIEQISPLPASDISSDYVLTGADNKTSDKQSADASNEDKPALLPEKDDVIHSTQDLHESANQSSLHSEFVTDSAQLETTREENQSRKNSGTEESSKDNLVQFSESANLSSTEVYQTVNNSPPFNSDQSIHQHPPSSTSFSNYHPQHTATDQNFNSAPGPLQYYSPADNNFSSDNQNNSIYSLNYFPPTTNFTANYSSPQFQQPQFQQYPFAYNQGPPPRGSYPPSLSKQLPQTATTQIFTPEREYISPACTTELNNNKNNQLYSSELAPAPGPLLIPVSHSLSTPSYSSPESTTQYPVNNTYSSQTLPPHISPQTQFTTTQSHFSPLQPTSYSTPPPSISDSFTPPSHYPPLTQSRFPPPPQGHNSTPSNFPGNNPPSGEPPFSIPPPPTSQSRQPHSSNKYSIHAKPQLLRKPYKAYNQQSLPGSQHLIPLIPPSPTSDLGNQGLTYLVPGQVSLGSTANSPLTSETSAPALNSNIYSPDFNSAPPIATATPTTGGSTPHIGQAFPNPYSARATPTPPSYVSQNIPVKSILQPNSPAVCPLPITQSVEQRQLPVSNHLNTVSSSTYTEPASTPATISVSCGAVQAVPTAGYQGYSTDVLHSASSLSSVPNTSSLPNPPNGIPLGPSKGYRLGKQRPRYAQVPDLAVSPSAHSPLLSPHNPPAFSASTAPPQPSGYQLGPPPIDTQVSASEVYLGQSVDLVSTPPEDFPSSFANLASQPGTATASAQGSPLYNPVHHHWFFKKEVEAKVLWKPFSLVDSIALENAFHSPDTTSETVVATDGGRYDVKVLQRQRVALYWEEKKPTEVRRCSWFYKGPLDNRYTPYEEAFAQHLEEEYKHSMEANKWNRKIEYNGETVMFHGPIVMVHYSQTGSTDQIGVPADTSPVKPRVVKRGVDEFEVEEGEPAKVDHLLFLVHGIGSVCDLKFRDVVETVDDFRSLALQLTRSHFSACVDSGQANRVEVLPVSWHGKLHGEDTGIDRKLQSITLKSIPRLRHFTNDTLLDILFYTSPVYCQTIMDTVGNEMNRMYDMFLKRNPDFHGSVSLGGHSLGSLILFDLLYHQKAPKHLPSSPTIMIPVPGALTAASSKSDSEVKGSDREKTAEEEEEDDIVDDAAMRLAFARSSSHNRRASQVNYMMGTAGTGQPYISYPQLKFKPENFFALGSPIGMFVTVRGIETLGSNFRLPTCPGFFNIFHPFDPVAYRVESLIDPELAPTLRPVMIPHHKGRKRMHLELKETMQRMGSDLKNKLVDSVKSTWNTMTQYTMFSRPEPPSSLEQEVTKVLEAHLGPAQIDPGTESGSECGDLDGDVTLGCLNGGRRVDYVLQEAPLESFNEYLFALQSHVCYWESEDTMLMILTEVYRSSGVTPDSALFGSDLSRERSPIRMLSDQLLPSTSPPKPQLMSSLRFPSSTGLSDSLSVPRSQSVPKLASEPNLSLLSTSSPANMQTMGTQNQPPQMGVDPTAPMGESKNLAPPPTFGFVKQALQRK